MIKLNLPHPSDFITMPSSNSSILLNSPDIPQDGNNTSVFFSSDVLNNILNPPSLNPPSLLPPPAGVRLYLGLENGELVMVAIPAIDQFNDFHNQSSSCAVGYHSSATSSRVISMSEANGMKRAEGESIENTEILNSLISVPNFQKTLSVYFSSDFLESRLSNDSIQFDLIELSFNDNQTYKSIAVSTQENEGMEINLLPCPPTCGGGGGGSGGTYDQKIIQTQF